MLLAEGDILSIEGYLEYKNHTTVTAPTETGLILSVVIEHEYLDKNLFWIII